MLPWSRKTIVYISSYLLSFMLNVDEVLVFFPTRQGEVDRVLNVCGNSVFELWGSKKAADKCMESLLKVTINLEYRMFS